MDGRAVAVIEGGEVFFIRTDHIGRPVFATNDLGLKVWEASYLPFGGVHVSTGAIALRFPGQWFQSESGLHQNWMRDYDPTTGRYLQADPLGLVDGASVYGYALGNPGRWVDPRGEYACYTDIRTGERVCLKSSDTYCPSGECVTRSPTENIRDPWPEFDKCVKTCLEREPFLDPDSWWPVSTSKRAQCSILSAISGKVFNLPRFSGGLLLPGCRRDLCEEECLSCEK
jgi:RHS repeat-associated protein